MEDNQIVALYWERNETAIAETEKKYGRYCYVIAYNVLYCHEDAEECVNDTYLRAWETIPPTRPASLGGYLTKIIRSIAINRYDRDRRDRRIPPEAVESLSDFEGFLADNPAPDEAESALIGEVISRYLRRCKKRRRYIFMARFYAARTVAEIAERLGVSRSAVKRELAGIRKELRTELEKEGIIV